MYPSKAGKEVRWVDGVQTMASGRFEWGRRPLPPEFRERSHGLNMEDPLVGRDAVRAGAEEGRLSRSPCPPPCLTHDLQTADSHEDLRLPIQGEDR